MLGPYAAFAFLHPTSSTNARGVVGRALTQRKQHHLKEILAMEDALSVLALAGAFLLFALGLLALTYARKISRSE